jgi:DNA-directed RNA polymerase specialized sigma24 family protein
LLGDVELLMALEFSGFAARQWDPVATEFARYGLGVLRAWIAKGTVYGRVRAMWGFGVPAAPVEWLDEDAIEAVATDTVLVALDKFRTEVLMRHRWDPAKGATLKTFFIGQCLFRFANVYMRWYGAERGRRRHVIAAEPHLLETVPSLGRPDLVVVGRALAAEALTQVTVDRAQRAFVMNAAGFSHREIATALGVADERSVENLLGHQRRKIRKSRGEGDG